ncbi:MAG: CAP domain-containing protein [Phycisphaerales bacterium]|nr:MAG: CAP domain-containing protein [Phycisphaerales bacterium]
MTRSLLATFLATFAITLAGGCVGTTGLPNGTDGTIADRIVTLVNNERISRGIWPLTHNVLLDVAAQIQADDMAVNAFFDHTGSDGSTVGDRAISAGYSWTMIGENIGQGDMTPEEMMNQWMSSPGHRANILNAGFTEIGVAINDTGTTLWVQVFGTP